MAAVAKGKVQLDGFSVAGVETAIEVPNFGVVLDMGRCSRTAVNQPVVIVSHGHLDHAGALAHHASRRAMMKLGESTYLVPAAIAPDVERLFNAAGELDGHPIPRKVVALEPGQDFALPGKKWVRPFSTFHVVPSQGYTVWERRHRLRQEFQGMPGAELAQLRARGVEIDSPHEVPLLSFTGDTRVDVLEHVEELRWTETLIMETTFLDDRISIEDARSMGHVHLDEVLQRVDLLPPGDIVFCHFSARHLPGEVQRILAERLPALLKERVRGFGADS